MWGSDLESYEHHLAWMRQQDRPQIPTLQRACFEGRADVVRQMLAAGADPEHGAGTVDRVGVAPACDASEAFVVGS